MIQLVYFALAVSGMSLLVIEIYRYLSPRIRRRDLELELFCKDTQRAQIFLPGKIAWARNHGVAIWIPRRSFRYAVVSKMPVPGTQRVFEFGIGRISIIFESEDLSGALFELERHRKKSLSEKKRFEELELNARIQRENADAAALRKKISQWVDMEKSIDDYVHACKNSQWPYKSSTLPSGASLDEAWYVVSKSIDRLVSTLSIGDNGSAISETRILVDGFVGLLAEDSPHKCFDEALLWSAIFALATDIEMGREQGRSAIKRLAERGNWQFVHGLAAQWARLEMEQLDRSMIGLLSEHAASALLKSWRISDPNAYLAGDIPRGIEQQINCHLDFARSLSVSHTALVFCTPEVRRLDEFVLLLTC